MLLRRESSFPTKAGAGVTWAECVYIYVYGGEVNTSLRGAVGTKSWYMACVSSSLCFPPRGGHQVAPQCWQGDSVISKEEMLPLDSRSLSGTATDTPGRKLGKKAATLLTSPSLKRQVISAPNASHSNQATHRPGQHLWMMMRAPKGDQNTESKV